MLPAETDSALSGPLPFVLSAPTAATGPGRPRRWGWSRLESPFDIRLQIRDEGLILNDSGGRSIHFEPLFPGEISYSRSESFWLARCGC